MKLPFIDGLVALIDPASSQPDMTGFTPEQERFARQAGFKNADEMLAFERNKSVRSGNSQTTGKPAEKKADPAPAPTQGKGTFGDVLNYISKALGGQL